jgi:hypothetical protein
MTGCRCSKQTAPTFWAAEGGPLPARRWDLIPVTPADLTLPSAPLIDVVVGQTCDHHRMLPRLHLTFQNGSPQFAEIRLRAFLLLLRDFVFCAVREEQTVKRKLAKKWSRYALADKQNYAETKMGGLASYTNLIICLE